MVISSKKYAVNARFRVRTVYVDVLERAQKTYMQI